MLVHVKIPIRLEYGCRQFQEPRPTRFPRAKPAYRSFLLELESCEFSFYCRQWVSMFSHMQLNVGCQQVVSSE